MRLLPSKRSSRMKMEKVRLEGSIAKRANVLVLAFTAWGANVVIRCEWTQLDSSGHALEG